MINAMRLTIGNGQSFENVSILTVAELQQYGMSRLFGVATFGFQLPDKKFKFVHADNVIMIHFNRSRPVITGAIPYERMVLNNDAVYSGGQIMLEEHHQEFGVEGVIMPTDWNQPVLFTAQPEGLMMISSQYIATLECKALTEGVKMELRQFSAQRLPR